MFVMKLRLLLKPEQENASPGFWGDPCLLQPRLQFLKATCFLLLSLVQNNI